MPNIDETKMSLKNTLFNQFIVINSREAPCWFIIVKIIFLIGLIDLDIIAFFFPRISFQSYQMIKKIFVLDFLMIANKKIEDIHYHRNAMTFKNGPYSDDIDNL
jgi:hypothetical protein